ncbi:MAG: hypothetical protein DDT22_01357 [candidate division WS2 bacterium]|nr:hypothetical protein [Candidatus Lithacetigena glycinireducens]
MKKYATSLLVLLLIVCLPINSIASGLAVRSPWKKVGPNVTLAIPTDRVGIGLETPNNRIQVAGLINFNDALRGTLLGFQAGNVNTGWNNTFIGFQAGFHNTTGGGNTFIGTDAGFANTTGTGNTFTGRSAGRLNTTGRNNTFIGWDAGFSNTTGTGNTFTGMQAGVYNTTGFNNTFTGTNAGFSNTTGANNTFIGLQAGNTITTGANNTFIGMNAGVFLADGATGNDTSNNSVFIGNDTRASAAGNTNEIVIGAGAIGSGSNTITLGNTSITRTILRGSIIGGTQVLSLPTPATPTITSHGVIGTTVWGYRVTARSAVGETLASVEGRTTTGNATLTTTNFNRITWSVVPGAIDYRIYRTTAGGTPATTGLIGTTTTTTFDDTGLAATIAVPTVDNSGNVGIGVVTPAAGNRLEVHDGHIVNTMTTPPGVTCNVGTPTIIGTDMGGGITVPAGASSCTITFTIPWNQIYGCVVSSSVSGAHPFVPALSNTSATFNFTATPAAVTFLYYHCSGR